MKKFIAALVAAVLLVMGALIGFSTPAFADEAEAPQGEYVTALWLVKGGPDNIWAQPQELVSSVVTDTPSLGAFDTFPLECGAYYQIDVYFNSETTASLLAGGVLYGPNNPQENLIPGDLGTAWKFLAADACIPPVEPPVVPNTLVETTDWSTVEWVCNQASAEQTRTVTTTTYALAPTPDGYTIVPTVTSSTETQMIQNPDMEVCPVVTPPVVTPPVVTPPVVAQPATVPVAVVNETLPDELAETGFNANTLLVWALAITVLGIAAMLLRHRISAFVYRNHKL